MKRCSECDHELEGKGSNDHYSSCSFGAEVLESEGSSYMEEDFYDAETSYCKNFAGA